MGELISEVRLTRVGTRDRTVRSRPLAGAQAGIIASLCS